MFAQPASPKSAPRLLGLVLAAVHLRCAFVDRVPALDLVAEHVDVVVQRLEREAGRRDLMEFVRHCGRLDKPVGQHQIELL